MPGQSRDYLGPFEVPTKSGALFFRAKVEGAPLTFTVVDRSVGEAWRRAYEQALPMAPAPGSFLGQGVLAIGEAKLRFPVTQGTYYIVIENTAAAPFAPLGVTLPVPEQLGYVSYSVELER